MRKSWSFSVFIQSLQDVLHADGYTKLGIKVPDNSYLLRGIKFVGEVVSLNFPFRNSLVECLLFLLQCNYLKPVRIIAISIRYFFYN